MLQIVKEPALLERNFPFGMVEVVFPETGLREEAFRALVDSELAALREKYADYDRKAIFGENPYFRFFRKFKKTYPVMLQLESVLLKGRPFPRFNVVAELPFLLELTTQVLSGAHDIERMEGTVELFLGTEKAPFPGMRGELVHTYPGDFCARDEGGIVFSLIAGADARTCAHPHTRHVLYPIFGTPELSPSVILEAMEKMKSYIRVLSPEAEIITNIL